jgi:hypothetical protein
MESTMDVLEEKVDLLDKLVDSATEAMTGLILEIKCTLSECNVEKNVMSISEEDSKKINERASEMNKTYERIIKKIANLNNIVTNQG